MDDLLAARWQMAISLGFHILFASAGIAMPLMMCIAEWRWLRTRDETWLALAKNWSRGTAILFAIGAVSGTVLSFELGLLWPEFMRHAGPIIGMPFSLEGFAFFTEAIFLGIYLYGWNLVGPRAHVAAAAIIAVSGAASGLFVVAANGWMNTPAGFRLAAGNAVDVDPVAAMFNPAAMPEAVHMLLAAYAATGFIVAGVHAYVILRGDDAPFHRKALSTALLVGGIAAVLQPVSGDVLARFVAETQPVKLAAMEGQFETRRGAPLRIGGLPDVETRTTPYAIEVPGGLSLLAYGDPNAEVRGLGDVDPELWPNVRVVHLAFQVMVGCGLVLMLVTFWAAWLGWKRRLPGPRAFLRVLLAASPLGFLAIETGWTVTELGRQPWIIQGVMKTADAVTPMPGLIVPMITFIVLYMFLGGIALWLLAHQVAQTRGRGAEERRSCSNPN
ncbi:MAG: cytochrome ubiquinol oxidase subunit I [Acidobacteria bacterium]|nr:cytochrome ubiquinol oxidase subunit I [Acidobacteriota bacterium]